MIFKNLRVVWVVVFFLLSLLGLLVGANALHKAIIYWKLDHEVMGTIDRFSVEKKKNRYQIFGEYHFSINNQKFKGRSLGSQAEFLNTFAARDAIKKMPVEEVNVFFNLKRPSLSSLNRAFPYKETVYFLIVMVILGYFVYFKRLIEKFKH